MAQEPAKEYQKVIVQIQWCGGWGYGPRFRAAKAVIQGHFENEPDKLAKIEVVSKRDPQVTGNFEITVNGALKHSKKTKGDGFLDTEAKSKAIFQAIEDALTSK